MRAAAAAVVVVALCDVGGLPPRHNQRCTKARKQCGSVHNGGFFRCMEANDSAKAATGRAGQW